MNVVLEIVMYAIQSLINLYFSVFLAFILPDFFCFFSILFRTIDYWFFTHCIYLCTCVLWAICLKSRYLVLSYLIYMYVCIIC